jgi:hypothetical protein
MRKITRLHLSKFTTCLSCRFEVRMAKFVTVICRHYTGQGFTCAPIQGVQTKSVTGQTSPDMVTRLVICRLLDIRANGLEQTGVQGNAWTFMMTSVDRFLL